MAGILGGEKDPSYKIAIVHKFHGDFGFELIGKSKSAAVLFP